MQRRQLLINATMSVMQILIVGGVLFILYKFLLTTIGIIQFGIWSVVVTTTSVTQIANLGLSASSVRFVAKYVAREENENVSGVIQTTSLSIGIFIGLVVLIGYPIIRWILAFVIPSESLSLALSILPLSLIALWITMVTSTFQAGLDGYQRIDLRSLLLMGGAIIHLLLCFILAPAYGLMGLAYAEVVRNFIIMALSWFLLRKQLPILPLIPHKWNKKLFREVIAYSIKFQIISLTTMLYDPITKAFLSKFANLSMVGYYEMASKMVLQFRSFIVSANQVIVPAIANLQEKEPEKIQSLYLTSYKLLFYLSLPLYSFIIICAPLISELWIGRYENVFVFFGILLSIGWFLNTLNVPSYFAYLGIGELRWNVAAHVAVGVLNAGLGFILGKLYDGTGVVMAWVISLALGSSIVYIAYHINNKIPLSELIPKESRIVASICLLSIIFIFLLIPKIDYIPNPLLLNSIILLIFSAIIVVPLWFHPMRKKLTGWVANDLLKRG